MIGDSNDSDTVLSALLASGDVAYAWDIVSDQMKFFGDTNGLFGAGAEVADGQSYHARLSAEDLPHRLAVLSNPDSANGNIDLEYRLRRLDGAFGWIHDRGKIEYTRDGQPARMTGTLRIVTDRKAAARGDRDSALYDALTGHYNRSRLREAVEHALSHARRYAHQGAYMVVGVDGLDQISNARADNVIVGVARRLEDGVRATDVIGRIDEGRFGVVLSRCGEDGLTAAAGNVIAKVTAEPIQTSEGPVPVSVSIGGVIFPEIAKTSAVAMNNAESAYQEAVRQGRDKFSLHRLSIRQITRQSEHTVLGAALLDALRENRIALAYQPVVRSIDSSVAYHETLLRVAGEESGPFEASVFIPVAEQLGHSRHIDRQVLELAAADLEAHPDISLAINISGLTVTDRSWLRLLGSFVMGRPDIAQRLTVEITETAEIHDFEEAAGFVASVRDLGCRVALDDFGVGYTSFRHLKSLPVDIVKIDGSFIRGIADNRENQEFVDKLLDLTRSFGVETVAECVESISDRDYLLDRGVNYLQGWIFGRPELDALASRSSSPAA
jgi:diguanylate cyclase (GGDEF)-like protein